VSFERRASAPAAQPSGSVRNRCANTCSPITGRCSLTPGTRVVGYVRVSTGDQADSGAGLEAQRAAIRLACEQRDWELVGVVEDAGFSAATLARPAITEAFELVESGGASVLVVAKLDRLSRLLLDFAAVMERSRRKRWALVALDLGVGSG
jgi:DNA invertase Pin-like site-specific DNA recombinase